MYNFKYFFNSSTCEKFKTDEHLQSFGSLQKSFNSTAN